MDCPACHQPNIDGARFCAKCGALLPAPSEGGGDSLIGQIIGGRYRVTQILGEGGMGRVYLAEQQMGTNVRKVAVKTLQAQYAKDQQVLARFHRECGTVSELEHPNTIQFFDFGQTPDGQLYIAMEFVQGQSLSDALQQGPMRPDRVLRILAQVCGSLEEAHGRGVVHRDLKPDNVILTTRAGQADFVKVLDFGIAKRSEAKDQAQEQKLTQQGMVLGTPPYMSPEQFTGKELDPRSDIYSLGVMAYEMATGRLPFDADTPWQWATQHMTAQPFPFEASPASAGIPEPMKHAIMRALSKDREMRQATVRQFYEELAGGGIGASPSMVGVGVNRGGDTTAIPPGAAVQVPSHPGFQPAPPGYAQPAHLTPAGGQTFPTSPQPQAMMGAEPPRRGGKGLIIGLAAAAAVLAVVGIVIGARQMSTPDQPTVATATAPTATPAPTPAATPSEKPTNESESTKATTAKEPNKEKDKKPTPPPPSASAPPPAPTPTLSGDAACAEAKKLADNGDAAAAAQAFHGCTGPGAGAARTSIARSAAASVQRKLFNGDCAGARALVAALAGIGAAGGAEAVVNADPKCKK
jgi:serine/threonine-protein kinase